MNVLLLVFLIGFVSAVSYPEAWERCKVSQAKDYKRHKCIERVIGAIVKDLADNGEETLGLSSIEPLKIKKISIGNSNPDNPVNIKVDLLDIDIHGFSKLKIKHVDGKFSSPQNWTFHMLVEAKKLTSLSTYKGEGKFLVLPISGNGDANITMEHVKGECWVSGQPKIVDGVEYLKINSDKRLSLNTTRLHIKLENLFNGDKTLGENMNRVLNENWQLLYEELRTSIEKELMKAFIKYVKIIVEKIPYKDLVIIE